MGYSVRGAVSLNELSQRLWMDFFRDKFGLPDFGFFSYFPLTLFVEGFWFGPPIVCVCVCVYFLRLVV